jgi:hypothetical protein
MMRTPQCTQASASAWIEAVERVGLASRHDLKGFVVVVAARVAFRHGEFSFERLPVAATIVCSGAGRVCAVSHRFKHWTRRPDVVARRHTLARRGRSSRFVILIATYCRHASRAQVWRSLSSRPSHWRGSRSTRRNAGAIRSQPAMEENSALYFATGRDITALAQDATARSPAACTSPLVTLPERWQEG